MPVVIGILILMGLVTKNAIIDFAVEEMARGVDRVTPIVDAGRKRARPIIMTTIAMAAGMVPSAIGPSSRSANADVFVNRSSRKSCELNAGTSVVA